MININNLLIIAPHIDDETLGSGGTILKLKKLKKKVSMILVCESHGYTNNKKLLSEKERQIRKVKKKYLFNNFLRLNYPSSKMYKADEKELIQKLNYVIEKIKPDTIILPFFNDAHSDHRIISSAVQSAVKIFRKKYVKTILYCEIISETDHAISSSVDKNFNPNLYIDISKTFKKKMQIFKTFKTENGKHPFPRSFGSLEALSKYRGSQSGYEYAEAFMVARILI
jgi:N-acetylglucosamine malate deacetylase 1